MTKKRFLSMLLSVAMLTASFTGISVHAEEEDVVDLPVIFTDSFDQSVEATTATGKVNKDWFFEKAGFNNYSTVGITDGALVLGGRHDAGATLVGATSQKIMGISPQNKISFDMKLIRYPVDWAYWYSSSQFVRFGVSDDGKSYYEVGFSGTNFSYYSLYPGDNRERTFYFRRVENGKPTYIQYDSVDYEGGFEDKASAYDPAYPQKVGSMLTGVHVVAEVTETGAKWQINGTVALANNTAEWKGEYIDESPLAAEGTGFKFGCAGNLTCGSFDNVEICGIVKNWKYYSDGFDVDSSKATTDGSNVNKDWFVKKVGGQNGSYYQVFDGYLGMFTRQDYSGTAGDVRPCKAALASLSAENVVSFDMSYLNYLGTGNTHWDYASTVISRTAVDDETDSWYELGITGCAGSFKRYPLPKSDEDLTVMLTDSDTAYAYRLYFRKVVGGETKHIEWENDSFYYPSTQFQGGANRGLYVWADNAISYKEAVEVGGAKSWNEKLSVTLSTVPTGINVDVSGNVWTSSSQRTPARWTINYVDPEPLAKDGTTFSFGACGFYGGGAIDNLNVKTISDEEEEEDVDLPIVDDFSYTVEDNAPIGEKNAVWSVAGEPQFVVRNENYGYNWVLSGNFLGTKLSDTDQSGAYFDSGKLYLKDRFQKGTTINMVFDKPQSWVSRVKFTSQACNNRRGIHLVSNEDENTYYRFGLGRSTDNNPTGITANKPYFTKVVKGEVVKSWYYSGDFTFTGTENWDIKFEKDGTISWKVTSASNPKITCNGIYKDPDIDMMMANMAYPASVYTLGDYFVPFDQIQIDCTEKSALYTVDAEDTTKAYVNIQPVYYRTLASKDYMTGIFAYYSDEDELLKAVPFKVDDYDTDVSFDVPAKASVTGAVRLKLFLFDGIITNNDNIFSQEIE